jgi:hypothetical protein
MSLMAWLPLNGALITFGPAKAKGPQLRAFHVRTTASP